MVALDRLLTPVCPAWLWPAAELRLLARAAVDFRYLGDFADQTEATEAFEIATRMRAKLLPFFGSSP
jgi:hypothetical protein